jgi:hypothetical protein
MPGCRSWYAIRTSGLYDGVADFDAATLDPSTGNMKAEYLPNNPASTPSSRDSEYQKELPGPAPLPAIGSRL